MQGGGTGPQAKVQYLSLYLSLSLSAFRAGIAMGSQQKRAQTKPRTALGGSCSTDHLMMRELGLNVIESAQTHTKCVPAGAEDHLRSSCNCDSLGPVS